MRNRTEAKSWAICVAAVMTAFAVGLPASAQLSMQDALSQSVLADETAMIKALEKVALIRLQQKKYQQAEALLKEELEIFERSHKVYNQKAPCLLALALVCGKTKRQKEAKDWIAQARSFDSYANGRGLSSASSREYALVEIEAGLIDEAVLDLQQAESALIEEARSQKRSATVKGWESLAALWKRIGRQDKFAALMITARQSTTGENAPTAPRRKVATAEPTVLDPSVYAGRGSEQASMAATGNYGSGGGTAGGGAAASGVKPYLVDVNSRIKKAWFPPLGNEGKVVEVVFKILHNGDISHLRVLRGSGVAKADDAAFLAVENAVPFGPLPSGSGGKLDIHYTFDYDSYDKGGRAVINE